MTKAVITLTNSKSRVGKTLHNYIAKLNSSCQEDIWLFGDTNFILIFILPEISEDNLIYKQKIKRLKHSRVPLWLNFH